MTKILIVFFVLYLQLPASLMQEGEFVKEKQELQRLKKELDEFYKIKEKEYQTNKKRLEAIELNIKKQLEEIKQVKKQNQQILDEIQRKIITRSIKLYDKMKIKVVKNILQKKIDSGEINDVFDIMMRLKDKRIMKLLKMFDADTSTELMNMMEHYKQNKQMEVNK